MYSFIPPIRSCKLSYQYTAGKRDPQVQNPSCRFDIFSRQLLSLIPIRRFYYQVLPSERVFVNFHNLKAVCHKEEKTPCRKLMISCPPHPRHTAPAVEDTRLGSSLACVATLRSGLRGACHPI